jgi:hypothetical protein
MKITNTHIDFARVAFVAALTLCLGISSRAFAADADTDADPGVRIAPKANKTYVVDGETMTFTELETRLTATHPSRIVIEFSRQSTSAGCAIMLGVELAIPIWTRSYNGRMKRLQIDPDAKQLTTIDRCR